MNRVKIQKWDISCLPKDTFLDEVVKRKFSYMYNLVVGIFSVWSIVINYQTNRTLKKEKHTGKFDMIATPSVMRSWLIHSFLLNI